MRICIPTTDDHGLEAVVHTHFGNAPYFTIVDTETGDVRVAENSETGHRHGSCRPLRQPGIGPFDAVACRSIGRSALATLADTGVDVYVTRSRSVAEVLDTVKAGRSTRVTSMDDGPVSPGEFAGGGDGFRRRLHQRSRRRGRGLGSSR